MILAIEIAVLLAVAIGCLASMGNSVGGAGFWTNVGWIVLGLGRGLIWGVMVLGVLFLVIDVARRVI